MALGTDDSAPLLFQRNTGGPPLGLKELASARRLSAATVASSTHLALGLLGAMYGCTQGTTRKPSGSDEAGREAAVWAPGLVVRHRRGGSVGLGLGALALSACGSSSCATLDTLARCSSSANSSAASTGGDASAGGPGSEGPGMEPCAGSLAGGSCSGQEDREDREEEEEEERELTAQEQQLAELRGLASSLFALMTTNLVFCSREAGAEEAEAGEEADQDDVEAAAGCPCCSASTGSAYSPGPSSAAAAGTCSSATSPGAACSPWAAAAAAGADAVASCPMAPRGFDLLRVRSNMSYALGAAAQDPGGASSDSEDDGGCGDACERAGSWGGAGAGAGQGRVGRRRSGRCEGVYLPAWSSLSLLAGAASPGGAAAEQEQLEATVAAGSPPSEPQSVEQAGPGSAPRRVLLAAAEALEPVLESPQEENEEVEGQQLECAGRAGHPHPHPQVELPEVAGQHPLAAAAGPHPVQATAVPLSPVPASHCLAATDAEAVESAMTSCHGDTSLCDPAPRANTSSPFAACCQQPAANMLVETPHTTRGASAGSCGPQADAVITAAVSAVDAAAAPAPCMPAAGRSLAAPNSRATRHLHTPTTAKSRTATRAGSAVTPVASPTSAPAPLLSSRSAGTLRSYGLVGAGGRAAAVVWGAPALSPASTCSVHSPSPSALTSPAAQLHTPSKPLPAAARHVPAASGSGSTAGPQLRRQSSTGSSCSSHSCSSVSVSAAGATPRQQRQAAFAAVAAAAEASLSLSRRRQAREQQAAEAAAASPIPSGGRSGACGGQQLPLVGGASNPAPAGSPGPGPGPSPSYLRSTAASAARAAVGMTPRAAAVHYSAAARQ